MSFIKSISTTDESVWAIMCRYMDQTKPLFGLTDIVLRTGNCKFSVKQRELIAAFTSGVNNCTYCYNTHRSTAEVFGVDERLLDELSVDINSSSIEVVMKPVLHYVKKLTLSPSSVAQTDVDQILDAGWDENDFHFMVMICSLFNFFNRLIEGYGVLNTMDYRIAHGRALAEHGYQLPD